MTVSAKYVEGGGSPTLRSKPALEREIHSQGRIKKAKISECEIKQLQSPGSLELTKMEMCSPLKKKEKTNETGFNS